MFELVWFNLSFLSSLRYLPVDNFFNQAPRTAMPSGRCLGSFALIFTVLGSVMLLVALQILDMNVQVVCGSLSGVFVLAAIVCSIYYCFLPDDPNDPDEDVPMDPVENAPIHQDGDEWIGNGQAHIMEDEPRLRPPVDEDEN